MFDDLINWLVIFLKKWFWWILDSILELIGWALTGLLTYLLQGLGYFFFTVCDGAFVFVHGFFSTLDLSSVAFNGSVGPELNAQLVWIINQLGLVQCVALLGTSISLRVLLNLIPATITRV